MSETDFKVGSIPLKHGEELRILIRPFMGKQYLNFRIFVLDRQGEWRPTHRGVTIRAELIDEILASLKEAGHVARQLP